MKKLVLIVWMTWSAFGQATANEKADSTGMPGDHLDLHAVLDEFKRSPNLEAFEKNLNDPAKKINNLDLNKDGKTDYIRVIDHADKKTESHAIVLQVPVNAKESQDVAVIEVEKEGKENARIQIVGDEDVYGEDYVVEPYENYVGKEEWDRQNRNEEDDVYGRPVDVVEDEPVVVNVWTWPCVTYIYDPFYDPWISPWYWGYYPVWWSPWQPYPWYTYHTHVWYYYGPTYYTYYYRRAPHRIPTAHNLYQHRRTTSPTYRKITPVVQSRQRPQNDRDENRNRINPNTQPHQNVERDRQNRENPNVRPNPNPSRQQPRVNPNKQPRQNAPRQERQRVNPRPRPVQPPRQPRINPGNRPRSVAPRR